MSKIKAHCILLGALLGALIFGIGGVIAPPSARPWLQYTASATRKLLVSDGCQLVDTLRENRTTNSGPVLLDSTNQAGARKPPGGHSPLQSSRLPVILRLSAFNTEARTQN